MTIIDIEDFALPGKFTSWRRGQAQMIEKVIESDKRFSAVCAATGSGKSVIYMALSSCLGRTCVLTGTKALQDQLCVAPWTRVLRNDLRWVRIDSLRAGDRLLGFDEYAVLNRRRWKESLVLATSRLSRPCYQVTLDDGTELVSSSDHLWLAKHTGGGLHWLRTDRLRVGGKCASKVARLTDVWKDDESYAAGYLAAAFDGEGHLHQRTREVNGGLIVDINMAFSQRLNSMLDRVVECLHTTGFGESFTLRTYKSKNPRHSEMAIILINKRREIIKFLGQLRPPRLLDKLKLGDLGMIGPIRAQKVIKRTFLGEQQVVSIKTNTRTFVAEGIGSHNCNDFREMGLVDMRGMNNYICRKAEDGELPFFRGSEPVSCEEGPCHAGYKCDLREAGCDYFEQKKLAAHSSLVVTNYAYWLRAQNQEDAEKNGLGAFDLLVCDESHNANEELANYLTVEIGAAETEELLNEPLPSDNGQPFKEWMEWAAERSLKLALYIAQIREEAKTDSPTRAVARHVRALKSLQERMHTIALAAGEWVVEEYRDRRGSRKTRFAPIDVSSYSNHLFLNVPKVLLVSATVRPKTLALLGIPEEDYDFLESPYSFPPSHRPVIHIPTLRMSHGLTLDQMLWWVNRIDQIVDRRLDRKGILHTVSYKRARFFMEHTRHNDIAWMPESHELRNAVEKFKDGNGHRKLLVSPSLTTGYDFPLDSCRYQIIGKIPFPDTRSKLLQAREDIDKDYGAYMAMQILVQSCGRAVRSENDLAEALIIDDHFFWFWKKYRSFAPGWFAKAVRTSNTVPDAMEI